MPRLIFVLKFIVTFIGNFTRNCYVSKEIILKNILNYRQEKLDIDWQFKCY